VGTRNAQGFYEVTWGDLMDSNPDTVINIVQQYNFTGDLAWLRSHKATCEKALDYILNRDSDGDYLVEVMNDSLTEELSSSWMDIIWASFETADLNAKMYKALLDWADAEEQLGDSKKAEYYRDFAAKLKEKFNKDTADGGFWNPQKQWYVHWREKDDSIHGDNLGAFLNFMAIAFDLCDQPERRSAILDEIEEVTDRENLFSWPITIYPYERNEGYKVNYPFPKYINGDIWPGWAILGVQAYADYKPEIAVKYIKKALAKYNEDGLAAQQYSRTTQKSAGVNELDDILAENCNPVVGLYAFIYGVQPKYNRLYLNPHMTKELDGTQLKYWLRNQDYIIDLSCDDYAVTVNNFKIRAKTDFAINSAGNVVEYFKGSRKAPALSITKSTTDPLEINIDYWICCKYKMKWTESSTNAKTETIHVIDGLQPGATYELYNNGELLESITSNSSGSINFTYTAGFEKPQTFEIKLRR